MDPDDVYDRIVEGDPYRRAEVTVRRAFPISLDRKVRLAIATLAASVPLGPLLFLQRDLVRSLEGTGSLAGTLSLQIGCLTMIGVVTGFIVGTLLVRQKRIVRRRPLGDEAARKLVRIEDLLAFLLVHGTVLVVIPTTLAIVGAVSPGTIEALYARGIAVYQPTGIGYLDARTVSAAGGLLAVMLTVLDGAATGGSRVDRT